MASTPKADAANAQFKKSQRDQDGKKAMAEYEAAGIATRARMAKLKALRLARDAELAAVPATGAAVKPARKAKPKPPTVSDFNKDREGSRKR